ncbi:hypothetical protein K438DRAFT_1750809 [Mycena galopus ATCC 62051]|nr:hypothetical protein K438DRAFT_1750809 [Mycena galopus ATCC 62051]
MSGNLDVALATVQHASQVRPLAVCCMVSRTTSGFPGVARPRLPQCRARSGPPAFPGISDPLPSVKGEMPAVLTVTTSPVSPPWGSLATPSARGCAFGPPGHFAPRALRAPRAFGLQEARVCRRLPGGGFATLVHPCRGPPGLRPSGRPIAR